ncbi:MAG: glycosyltransferase, partial [Nitrospirota bacterium]
MSHPLITTAQSLIQANRLQQAREVLISVLEEDSQNAEALLALAAIEVREGKLHSGLECIDEVLRIAPDNPDALRERLLVQEKIKQQDNTTPEEMAPLPEGAKKPDFSIIIPVYNQVKYTKQCIETVQATCTNHTYEIIVIDDCSTDDTHVYLESVKDTVRSFRNRKNQGFILNCNFAASQARGEYIVLLNNDTIPQTNWLEGLLEPFTLFDKVAATGALMIHPDNKILEACSIVFSDGSGWNYGRGEDPDLPQYQYIREVDYVSGGGMMVPKKIWNELGGLDTYYCPAYYDDIDFCFRARRAGYKVLYTPFSRIIHFEGMTGGTDVTKGVKRYQLINQQKFNERWKDELAKQYENKFENVFRAARRESGKRILWIDHSLPLPNFNSGCLRMNNLLKSVLSLGHQVTYVALSNSDPGNYKTVMRKMGVETHTLNYERWEHSHDRDALIERALDMLNVGNNNYDIVYLSFYWVATLFIKKIRRRLPAAIIHVDSHDIHFLREKREAELYKTQEYARKAERTRIHELSVYSRADAIMTVTELDRQAILKELPNAVVMLMPNVHDDMPAETGFSERKDLLFVGGFNHTPNVDAMLCFCRTIFPKIKTVIPEIRLWIVGSNPTDEVKALANDSIMVTGWVDDTNPYLEKSRISIAPLRYGAGMKGKVGEAMSHGLPVITTPVGSEGMGIVHEEHALVVNSVDEWVDAIQKLYQDEALWNRLSQNGRELMRKNYGSDAMLDRARTVFGFQSRDEVAALSSCPSQRFFANGITSIVILTHNQLDYTKKCVRSIQENTPEPHEIVFVDNASRDGTVKWLRRLMHEHPNYLLIENSWNHGFARGCNQGIEASSGEHILLLNNDVVVTRGWLA